MTLTEDEKKRIEDEERFRAQVRARIGADVKQGKKGFGCLGCLGSVLLVIFVAALVNTPGFDKSSNTNHSDSPVPTALCRSDSVESIVEAKSVILSKLKAPGSAKIISIKSRLVKNEGDGCSMLATGVVDAQNSFGAEIRETMYVILACSDSKRRCLGSGPYDGALVPDEYKYIPGDLS